MPAPTHVLFDFFGTLVAYSESRTDQGYRRSHELLLELGADIDYAAFLERWAGAFDELEARAQHSLDEYSMDAVCGQFLSGVPPSTSRQRKRCAVSRCVSERMEQGRQVHSGSSGAARRAGGLFHLGLGDQHASCCSRARAPAGDARGRALCDGGYISGTRQAEALGVHLRASSSAFVRQARNEHLRRRLPRG